MIDINSEHWYIYYREGDILNMKDNENLQWEMNEIAHQYKAENPDWTWKECWAKAKLIYRELNKLNRESFRETKRFFKMNTPFSFFDDRDGEFGEIYVDYSSK